MGDFAMSECNKFRLDFLCLRQHKKVQGVQFKAERAHRTYEPSLYQHCYPYSQTDEAARSGLLSTTHRRADDINCCRATDDSSRSAVLSTTRHRADINCCTVTDDDPRSAVFNTTRCRADDINCRTATDDSARSAVLSTTRHRADINCCTVTDDDPALQYLILLAVERTT